MLIKIVSSKVIKPMLIRFDLEVMENNLVIGESAFPVDMNNFVKESDDSDQLQLDVAAFQNHVTQELARLQQTFDLASKLKGFAWMIVTDNRREVEGMQYAESTDSND